VKAYIPTGRRKRSRVLPVTLVIVALLAVGVAVMASYFAQRYYVQRAQLQLQPTHATRFSGENAQLPAPQRPRVVLFGDSRIAGWNPRPISGVHELVWRGVRGESTAQMRYRYDQDTRGIGATIVVLQAGINDLSAGVAAGKADAALEQAFENLRAMVASSRANGIQVFVMTVVPPASPPPWRRLVWSDDIYGLVEQLNRKLHSLSGPGVTIFDAKELLCGDADRVPAHLARDTMHLRADAYALLNNRLTDVLGEYKVALQ
jgi:lysophospholipase L1-like esterase